MSDSGLEQARTRLARDQAALLAALVAGGPPPRGFDRAQLDVQRRILLAKRADTVARAAPGLPAALGEEFRGLFLAYARTRPLTGGYHRDAAAFADHLLAAGLPRAPGPRRRLADWRAAPRPPRSRLAAAVRALRPRAAPRPVRPTPRSAKGT
ncbi:hypothetical protein [Streptomyces sp. NPDC051162]|uniref:hypothetical protein n=1 Tax=Streptomyces sp. NPDC051162 TaxID=3154747 RepID=UPI0034361CAA